ncbi:MAG: zinc-ribbon domain-containing protein [Polyangiaceae bacterium]|nr:zinc-ribbon domain-containing protein [Polyangiaceae bacterium]
MKFACEQCGRKYVLADEKIAAKEDVRLKCRQCGEVVVVKQAGEIVASSLATPVPRLPVPEGAVPPPAMPPPLKRASGRAPAAPPSSEQEVEEPSGDVSPVPRISAPELPEGAPVDSGKASETPCPSSVERTSAADGHSETVPETMRASAPVLPRPSLPRLKRPSAAPPEPGAEAEPSSPLEVGHAPSPSAGGSIRDGDKDRPAGFEPVASVAIVQRQQPEPGTQRPAGASVPNAIDRLWLGASNAQEKRRMLIALGVGFVLGTLFGLMF